MGWGLLCRTAAGGCEEESWGSKANALALHTPAHSTSARHTARKRGRISPIMDRFVYFDGSSLDLSCTRKSLPHFKLAALKRLKYAGAPPPIINVL